MYIPVSYKKKFNEYYDVLENVDKALRDMNAVIDAHSHCELEDTFRDFELIRADEAMSHSWNLLEYVIVHYNNALNGVSQRGADGYNSLLSREALWGRAEREFKGQYIELTAITMRHNIENLTESFTDNKDFPELSREKIGSDFKNVLDNFYKTLQHTSKNEKHETQK